jgi:hypothetical protein
MGKHVMSAGVDPATGRLRPPVPPPADVTPPANAVEIAAGFGVELLL